MGQGKYLWSKTPANNATADGSINWAEGMAPSAVNDSARAEMAREAEWRDDISGTITTGGTSTAYTVASNQVFDTLAHMNGAMIAFVPHTTNGATVTINVDGLGGKPLRFSPGVEVQSGVLIQGTPYVATYNNSDGAFYLQGLAGNPYGVPLGGLMPYLGSNPPNSAFALPYGQALSQITYATLYAVVGANAFAPDSGGNFFLPDLRGRFIAGQDNMGGSPAGRISTTFNGAVRGAVGGLETQTLTASQIPSHTHSGTTVTESAPHTHGPASGTSFVAAGVSGGSSINSAGGAVSTGTPSTTGNEIGSHTHTFTTDGGTGGGASHPIMPPAMTLPYILRII